MGPLLSNLFFVNRNITFHGMLRGRFFLAWISSVYRFIVFHLKKQKCIFDLLYQTVKFVLYKSTVLYVDIIGMPLSFVVIVEITRTSVVGRKQLYFTVKQPPEYSRSHSAASCVAGNFGWTSWSSCNRNIQVEQMHTGATAGCSCQLGHQLQLCVQFE